MGKHTSDLNSWKGRHESPSPHFWLALRQVWGKKTVAIAILALFGIAAHLVLRFSFNSAAETNRIPLFIVLALGGGPLVFDLLRKLLAREFGSDLLAGISITASVLLGEYLAGSIVVLMLSGGEALENYAVRNASSVLRALAQRMPSVAHRKLPTGLADIPVSEINISDIIVVYPHEVCPVDGIVTDGHGRMDESFLTGEPFDMTKAPGTAVISGAVNGESALTIQATRRAQDSRYAKIMQVLHTAEENRPRIRRLADKLGAVYTPIAVALALGAWLVSGEALRFLAVLVVATPCPLLIAIPVAIIGSISLSARRAIVIKNPAALEQVNDCRTAIFDKTGTLTYGEPTLIEEHIAPGFARDEVLALIASVEVYSRHPLARAVIAAARHRGLTLREASEVSELPGQGLRARVANQTLTITSRNKLKGVSGIEHLPPPGGGLECAVIIDGGYAATYRFRDAPRAESLSLVGHLRPKHRFHKLMIVSGDRESEVRYLAEQVGIKEVFAEQSPEQKLDIVRRETTHAPTLYVGDGINDAPAMMAATVGIAVGQNTDVTAEAADVVAMENSLKKVDEFIHISRRMRRIALQSAIGGMVLSIAGMFFAAAGYLPPVGGAIAQEVIDIVAVLNALRAAWPPKVLSDL